MFIIYYYLIHLFKNLDIQNDHKKGTMQQMKGSVNGK